jgi:hypothetical protein
MEAGEQQYFLSEKGASSLCLGMRLTLAVTPMARTRMLSTTTARSLMVNPYSRWYSALNAPS